MTNIEKLKNAFVEGLEIPVEGVETATMENIDKWDSIGQMSLVAMIEDEFGIELEPDEVMQFTSFATGLEILKHHNIDF
ncbi:MAG: acyl carrier protein [Bacteroidaceae bacterium]|nr:acyl carrier protein [Bacteroidaceae bacterium]